MSVPARIETVVIGAGQSGLAMSHLLSEAGRAHIVLERRMTLGGGWQDRWNEFRLVTPNWTSSLPGFPYDGSDPDGFMKRDEIAGRIARYADVVHAPVVLGAAVERLSRTDDGFRLETTAGDTRATSVIVATGTFHGPIRPAVGAGLPERMTQLHTHEYRDERSLPPGGVLVVGSGQSGVQIAEELLVAGRETYLSVGSAGWAPRRYRGRDLFDWLFVLAADGARHGVPFPTVDRLPDPRLRFAPNPQLSGHGGGHDIDLRALAANGLTLLGHVESADGDEITLRPGLGAALARSEGFFDERFRPLIDLFIERAGIDAPADERSRSTFEPPDVPRLNLSDRSISSVIWASGYRPDFSWIDLPILDEQGLPRHSRGVSEVPGLAFLGLLWQHTQASATLFGPTQDAPFVLESMAAGVT